MDRSCDKGKHWDISFVPLESDSAISGKTCRVVGRRKKGYAMGVLCGIPIAQYGVIQPYAVGISSETYS